MSLRRFQAVLRGPGKDQQRQLQCASLGVGEGPAMVAGTGPSFRLSVSHALCQETCLGSFAIGGPLVSAGRAFTLPGHQLLGPHAAAAPTQPGASNCKHKSPKLGRSSSKHWVNVRQVSFNCAASACEKALRWRTALLLRGPRPDAVAVAVQLGR